MTLFVDSREPEDCRKAALRAGFIQLALDYGDYQGDAVVFERKEIGDLVNSIFARYGDTPRLFDQMDRIFDYCQRSEKEPWLIVCGNLEHTEEEFKKRGQTLNRQAIYGALASVSVRYDINIIWSERTFEELLEIMKSIEEKTKEGKRLIPMRKKLKEFSRWRSVASVCSALQVSPKIAENLVKKFGGLYGILDAAKHRPHEILIMDGIGQATFNKITSLGGVDSGVREKV